MINTMDQSYHELFNGSSKNDDWSSRTDVLTDDVED